MQCTILVMFWLFVNKVISNPIGRIIACIEQLADGDLTARIQLSGKTELVKLSESLNNMGGNLHKLVSILSGYSRCVWFHGLGVVAQVEYGVGSREFCASLPAFFLWLPQLVRRV